MTMGQEQSRVAYPILPDPLTPHDVRRQFTPWPDEIEWAFSASSSVQTRLGLLTLLKVFETLGRFISPNEIPVEIIRHVARCAGLTEADAIDYSRALFTVDDHLIGAIPGSPYWSHPGIGLMEPLQDRLIGAT